MPEPTLALALNDLQVRVGSFLGYGTGGPPAGLLGDPPWNNQQQFDVADSVQSGQRAFFYPSIEINGAKMTWDWSFMRPTATLILPSGAQTIALPDDFGGAEDKISILTAPTAAQPWDIEWRNEGWIRQMYAATPQMSGPPIYAAISAIKGTTPTASQRFQLLIFPAADQQYTLQFPYYVNPDALSPTNPFPYGGAEHSETLLESCLAVAEQRKDDAAGIHTQLFQQRLWASIEMDRKKKPLALGYNGDKSDQKYWDRRNVHWWAPPATYMGASFNA